MSDEQMIATLFGISHVQGLAYAFRETPDFAETPISIKPWTQGKFTGSDGSKFNFVVGWWDKGFLGDFPTMDQDGTLVCSNALIFFQLNAVDAYASSDIINLGPYDIEPKWDFSHGSNYCLPSRCPVRYKDVLGVVQQTVDNVLVSSLVCKHQFFQSKLHYVFPPPPVESDEYIMQKAEQASGKHVSYMERYKLLLRHGIRPFSIRKKLLDMANEMLKSKLAAHGIDCITPPAECLTAAGGLDERFALDMHHGNELYNKAVIRKISELLK